MHGRAERAVTATLGTLGERISGGEAHDLAGQLPPELQRLVDRHAGDGPRPLSAGEFFQRARGPHHILVGWWVHVGAHDSYARESQV
ncbi:MAG: hypothetical protein JWR63_3590 [Conexibacter sp.]|nr:hypothetical protein [Conexibacter sp.]